MDAGTMFQCSPASRKFLNVSAAIHNSIIGCFSAFSEPKFLNYKVEPLRRYLYDVSVLFSEPKIPQCRLGCPLARVQGYRFSALQRAENSSIVRYRATAATPSRFSALQRAENSSIVLGLCNFLAIASRFSALQRAENSSILIRLVALAYRMTEFQCSSASRKFLNRS